MPSVGSGSTPDFEPVDLNAVVEETLSLTGNSFTPHLTGTRMRRDSALSREPPVGATLQSGGTIIDDVYGQYPELGWERLAKEFLRSP